MASLRASLQSTLYTVKLIMVGEWSYMPDHSFILLPTSHSVASMVETTCIPLVQTVAVFSQLVCTFKLGYCTMLLKVVY